MTTRGVITEYPLPTSKSGPQPNGIAAGSDGTLWLTEPGGNRIRRVSTGGAITEFPLPTANGGPLGIANGPDGAILFTENYGNKIGRIKP